ncbi:MAG: PAS domain S-box protein [Deltaproteobacteria bacterium]|nr:MAG: PAS domain S-box protein [Deltaproteobacteria bacterium]
MRVRRGAHPGRRQPLRLPRARGGARVSEARCRLVRAHVPLPQGGGPWVSEGALDTLRRERDRLARRLDRERSARAEAESIAERAIRDLSRINRSYETFFTLGVHLYCTVDAGLCFRDLNPSWDGAFGWSLDELRGRSVLELVHPDDVEATAARAQATLAKREPTLDFCHRFRTRDGAWRWLEWAAQFADGRFFAEARDVTEMVQMTTALRESEERHRAIVENAVDAIVTIDERGAIESANPATERLFGYREEDLVGRNVSLLAPSPHRERHDAYLQHYLETGEARVIGIGREVAGRRKDGSVFPIELSVSEVRLEGRRLFTGIIRDVTEQKAAQRQIAETLADLEKSRDDLRTTLDQLRVGTLIVAADGRIDFASRTWEAMAGREAASVAGLTLEAVLSLSAADRQAFERALDQPAGERKRVSLSLQRPKALPLAVEVQVENDPRDEAARIFYFYDVSEVVALRSLLAAGARGNLIGNSAPMRELYEQIGMVAKGDWTVLIEGETGTGKELVARAVHAASPRGKGRFVAVNCAGLTDTLLESQLFGHRKGAFTGAIADQEGLFEAAAGGTLLLDEIGDISLKLQATLLRAIQEKEVLRVGDTRARPVDVRILVATHRDLSAEVAAGRFRADLLYRIRVARLQVPSLRSRPEDVPLLAASFVAEHRARSGDSSLRLEPAAMAALQLYRWPGNVRELRAAIEYAVIRCPAGAIRPQDLPPEVTAGASALVVRPPVHAPLEGPGPIPAGPEVAPGDERARLLAALEWAEGNRARAARKLGMGRATLYRRLAELGIGPKKKPPA